MFIFEGGFASKMNLQFLLCGLIVAVSLLQESYASNATSFGSSLHHRAAGPCAPISWEPELEPDGTFSAVQCKGEEEDGRCFCWSPTGSRIFGWSWRTSAKDMTCSCSRRRYRLTNDLGRTDVSLHCTQNGNFEQLQCDNDLCWCTEPKTGKPTERLFPQSMMKHLPCYKKKTSEIDGEDDEEEQEDYEPPQQYLRKCESKALARFAVLKKLETHGRVNAHIDEPSCDYDGSYAKMKIEKKRVFCVWKDGEVIGNYQVEITNLRLVDCNCARDIKIYEEENLELSMSCNGNSGNYEPTQMSNGRPYCVDSDGFATTELCNMFDDPKC